jgi:hypothetical protein
VLAAAALAAAVVLAALLAAEAATAGGPVTLRRGALAGMNDYDSSGVVRLVRLPNGTRALRFTNVRIDSGPALRVYLVAGRVRSDADVRRLRFKDLGRLKGFRGAFDYPVPASVNVARYFTVVVWCEEFSVGFGRAELRRI